MTVLELRIEYLLKILIIFKLILFDWLIFGKKDISNGKIVKDITNSNVGGDTYEGYGCDYFTYRKSGTQKSKCILKSKDFFKPFIEPEFSFKIKKNTSIYNKKFSIKNINKYIDYILPSIEVVDSRFNDWKKIGINNLIADNGVNAYWIYGKKTKNLSIFNLNNHIVKLYINNKLLEIGNSKNVLKNPLNSIVWLLNYLSKQGKNFLSESFISTGTCTPAIPIKKGDIIVADFGKLGKIEVNYI